MVNLWINFQYEIDGLNYFYYHKTFSNLKINTKQKIEAGIDITIPINIIDNMFIVNPPQEIRQEIEEGLNEKRPLFDMHTLISCNKARDE